jgi:hypothetical protein
MDPVEIGFFLLGNFISSLIVVLYFSSRKKQEQRCFGDGIFIIKNQGSIKIFYTEKLGQDITYIKTYKEIDTLPESIKPSYISTTGECINDKIEQAKITLEERLTECIKSAQFTST